VWHLLRFTHRKDELDGVWGDKQTGPEGGEVLGQAHSLVWPGLFQRDDAFRLPAFLLLAEVLAQGGVQPQSHLHRGPAEMVRDVEVVFLDGVISSAVGKDSKETLTHLRKGHKPRSDGCVPMESTLLRGQVSTR